MEIFLGGGKWGMSANIDFVDIDVLGQEDLVLVHLFFHLFDPGLHLVNFLLRDFVSFGPSFEQVVHFPPGLPDLAAFLLILAVHLLLPAGQFYLFYFLEIPGDTPSDDIIGVDERLLSDHIHLGHRVHGRRMLNLLRRTDL